MKSIEKKIQLRRKSEVTRTRPKRKRVVRNENQSDENQCEFIRLHGEHIFMPDKRPGTVLDLDYAEDDEIMVAIHAPATKGGVYLAVVSLPRHQLVHCELCHDLDAFKARWHELWTIEREDHDGDLVISNITFRLKQGALDGIPSMELDPPDVQDPVYEMKSGAFFNTSAPSHFVWQDRVQRQLDVEGLSMSTKAEFGLQE